jgi:hypothetical protein
MGRRAILGIVACSIGLVRLGLKVRLNLIGELIAADVLMGFGGFGTAFNSVAHFDLIRI